MIYATKTALIVRPSRISGFTVFFVCKNNYSLLGIDDKIY